MCQWFCTFQYSVLKYKVILHFVHWKFAKTRIKLNIGNLACTACQAGQPMNIILTLCQISDISPNLVNNVWSICILNSEHYLSNGSAPKKRILQCRCSRYLHKTITIVVTITSIIRWAQFHLAGTINGTAGSFSLSLSNVILVDQTFPLFHQYLRYSHKWSTVVFSIPGAILWVQSYIASMVPARDCLI